jgi:hypothetical protein
MSNTGATGCVTLLQPAIALRGETARTGEPVPLVTDFRI